ncbi:MAG TPA: BamA/TamA family outer membrane protein, partial [Panacibacter sp.]|nr:BamA/TamA family outer membrane protein [Panacibacter sp.]
MRKKIGKLFLNSLIIWIACIANARAQTAGNTVRCPVKDIADIIKRKDSIKVAAQKNSYLLIIPVVGSQPATGFMYGVTSQYTFKGIKPEDKYSTVNISTIYTSKKQLLINLKNNVLLHNNKVFLSGDWRVYFFSQSNYGLGTNIIPSKKNNPGFALADIEEPMEYNYIKLHQTVSWKVKGNFYAGGGIHIDAYNKIKDQMLDTANNVYTQHYSYSKKYGFNPGHYSVSGVSVNLVYDSRDNQINANHGWFGNINYRINPALNKKQQANTSLYTELRYFKPLDKKNVQHVLAFWAYGQFTTSGKTPYLNLPAIGWDQRSRAGKGYTQGLFRGFNLIYTEIEYRFPITCNQLVSGTVVSEFTSASNRDEQVKMFQYIQPAIGVGIRILLDKATRTNFVLNYGWG